MGKFIVIIKPSAKKDLKKLKDSRVKATEKKVIKMLEELTEHPYSGIGKPEALKHQLKGYWSRRINKKDRLIYRVEEDTSTVYVLSAIGHYSDT